MDDNVSTLLPKQLNRKRIRSCSLVGDACINDTSMVNSLCTDHYSPHQRTNDCHSYPIFKRRHWWVDKSAVSANISNSTPRRAEVQDCSTTGIRWQTRRLNGSRSFKTLLGLERKMLAEQLRVFGGPNEV